MPIINHQISMRLEMAARSSLNLHGRGGLYGVVDADYIDQVGNAFTVLVAAVSPYYKDGDNEVKARIDSFLEKYSFLDDKDGERESYSQGVDNAATELRALIKEL